MHPLFHVETMKVECNPQHIPQEAIEMFGHALCIPGNFRSMRFEVMESQFDPTVYSPNPVNMMMETTPSISRIAFSPSIPFLPGMRISMTTVSG